MAKKKTQESVAEIEDKDDSMSEIKDVVSELKEISYKPLEKYVLKQKKEQIITKQVDKVLEQPEQVEEVRPKPEHLIISEQELEKQERAIQKDALLITKPLFKILNMQLKRIDIEPVDKDEQLEVLELVFEKMFKEQGTTIMKTIQTRATDIKLLVFFLKSIVPRIIDFVIYLYEHREVKKD